MFGNLNSGSEERIRWQILLIATLVLALLCFLIFVFCFETWAVDSPVGFWNWHS